MVFVSDVDFNYISRGVTSIDSDITGGDDVIEFKMKETDFSRYIFDYITCLIYLWQQPLE